MNPSWIHVKITNQDDIEVGFSNLMLAQVKDRHNRFEWAGAPIEGQNYWSPESLLQVRSSIEAAERRLKE